MLEADTRSITLEVARMEARHGQYQEALKKIANLDTVEPGTTTQRQLLSQLAEARMIAYKALHGVPGVE